MKKQNLKNKKTNYKKTAGITLIALVVTIIVLLILAGISIMMLSGNNGILTRAGESKNLTEQSQLEEEVKLAYLDYKMQTNTNESLETYLNKIDGAEIEKVTKGVYNVKKNNKEASITDDGNVTQGKTEIWNGEKSEELEGSGTEEDPFLIKNGKDLAFFSDVVNNSKKYTDKDGNEKDYNSASYKQIKDIYLNDISEYDNWTDESTSANLKQLYISYFSGKYEGNNNKIIGVYINEPSTSRVGFFKRLYYANINNLNLEYSYVIGQSNVGVLCGSADVSNINNCKVGGTVQGENYVGGLMGVCYGDYRLSNSNTINKCTNNAKVNGNIWVGGLFGQIYGYGLVAIEDCHNNGEIVAWQYVGGICGAGSNLTIRGNTNNNNIIGSETERYCYYLGGIIGELRGGNIENCINKGNIIINNNKSTVSQIGGIVGITNKGNNIELNNINNTNNLGNIKIEVEHDANTLAYEIGGIIGNGTSANVNNTNNNGNITLSEGLVDNSRYNAKGVGGIIGYIYSNVTITESTNSGTITVPETITWGDQVGYQKP